MPENVGQASLRIIALCGIPIALVLGAPICLAKVWFAAAVAADDSAHMALASEIWDQLAAVPPGQPYPTALTQLHLKK